MKGGIKMAEKQDKKAELLKAVREITDKLNEREIKPPFKIVTDRKQKPMRKIPKDIDFEMKEGSTTYEVVSHFNPEGEEYFINQIIRRLGYKYDEYD